MLAVGPEAALPALEVESAANAGWLIVSLGLVVLRVETAAVVLMSLIACLADRKTDTSKRPTDRSRTTDATP